MAFFINLSATSEDNKINRTMHLGRLFTSNIIQDPKVFYCPSDRSNERKYEDYVGEFSWPFTSDKTRYHAYVVRTGYCYVPSGRKKVKLPNDMYAYDFTTKYSDLGSNSIIIADYIMGLSSLNHRGGGNKAGGINAIFGDGHVSFCNTEEALDSQYWSPSPNQNIVNFRTLLTLFSR